MSLKAVWPEDRTASVVMRTSCAVASAARRRSCAVASAARRRSCAVATEACAAQRSSIRFSNACCASINAVNAEACSKSSEGAVAFAKSPRTVAALAHASRTAVPPEGISVIGASPFRSGRSRGFVRAWLREGCREAPQPVRTDSQSCRWQSRPHRSSLDKNVKTGGEPKWERPTRGLGEALRFGGDSRERYARACSWVGWSFPSLPAMMSYKL